MNTQINLLPTPTWNHLGVNHAGQPNALPAPPAQGWGRANTAVGPLPAGVRRCDALPPACAGIENGMGPQAERFVQENANAACFLQAEGRAGAPVWITHTLDAAHPAVIADQAIHAAPGAQLTVVQVCRGGQPVDGVAASLTRICAGRGAAVRLVQVQLLGEHSRHWGAVGVRAAEGAQVELVRVALGGAAVACGSHAALEGRAARYTLSAAYFGAGSQALDFNDTAVHTGKETESELHTAGVLAGQSQKILRGTIDFRRGAVHAVGHESEDVLLFGPAVRNRTVPLILCGEEQVEGQHAATAGRLDERVLYYLASRGLQPGQARRLMVEARYAPVLDQIPDEGLRAEALAYLARRLDEYAELPG